MSSKNLKTRMLEEAYQMISEEGFDNFSVRILSKHLDVSHNALYKHFSSKSELLFEVVKLGFEKLTSAFISTKNRTDIDEKVKLKEITYSYVEFAVDNPHLYKLMFNFDWIDENFPEDVIFAYSMNYKVSLDITEECIKNGFLRNASALTFANTLWAFSHGLSMLLIDKILGKVEKLDSAPQLLNIPREKPDPPVRDVIKFSVDMIYEGLFSIGRSH